MTRIVTNWDKKDGPDTITIQDRSIWTHNKTGNKYQICKFANTTGDRWPVIIVYNDTNGDTWARPASEWYSRYTIAKSQDDMEFF